MGKMQARRRRSAVALALACAAVCTLQANAQPTGIVDRACPAQSLPSSTLRRELLALLIEPHTITREERERFAAGPEAAEAERPHAAEDWADLCRYRALDESSRSSLMPPRVVFLGDSITENWGLADPALFDGRVANRGIGGQTTAQMLVRFRADVVSLRPQTVHILAGIGDVAGNAGPLSVQDFKNNIMSMADLARLNAIDVVLGSIPPASALGPQPTATIQALNEWLETYAAKQRVGFVDYYSALVGSNGEFRADLSNDGVHPNRNGYAIMRKLAEKALAAARAR